MTLGVVLVVLNASSKFSSVRHATVIETGTCNFTMIVLNILVRNGHEDLNALQ